MVFDRCYDGSLWLMLYENKEQRERIADFIKSIPDELYKQIKESIVYYQNYLLNNNLFDEEVKLRLCGEFKTSGDMLYWYVINYQTGSLHLGEIIVVNEEEQYDNFQMTLFPLKFKRIMKMANLDNYSLGDITYDYAQEYIDEQLMMTSCKTTGFHLIKLPFGRMLINSCESFPYIRNRYGLINMEKIPCNYNVSDLSDKDSLNRLVRRRRKNI